MANLQIFPRLVLTYKSVLTKYLGRATRCLGSFRALKIFFSISLGFIARDGITKNHHYFSQTHQKHKKLDPETGTCYHPVLNWIEDVDIQERLVDVDNSHFESDLEYFRRTKGDILGSYKNITAEINADQLGFNHLLVRISVLSYLIFSLRNPIHLVLAV